MDNASGSYTGGNSLQSRVERVKGQPRKKGCFVKAPPGEIIIPVRTYPLARRGISGDRSLTDDSSDGEDEEE
ncbi:hypothetical protein HY407_01475 [Candidatus Gottesmanbacteria bacterium]|nr:hypothetical protein [Candidatus Gottesmanbacteria bacterium]